MGWVEQNLLPRVYAELKRLKGADADLMRDVATASGRDLEEELLQDAASAQAAADRATAERAAQEAPAEG